MRSPRWRSIGLNRLANAFDFSWDSDQHVRVGAQVIHRISYRLPRILMR
jgi:hypothetical protein